MTSRDEEGRGGAAWPWRRLALACAFLAAFAVELAAQGVGLRTLGAWLLRDHAPVDMHATFELGQ